VIVPDGSGGLWIPVPGIDGEPGQIVHFTGGKLHEASLPITGQRLIVQAIAHVLAAPGPSALPDPQEEQPRHRPARGPAPGQLNCRASCCVRRN
jgi:hypothetical protein